MYFLFNNFFCYLSATVLEQFVFFSTRIYCITNLSESWFNNLNVSSASEFLVSDCWPLGMLFAIDKNDEDLNNSFSSSASSLNNSILDEVSDKFLFFSLQILLLLFVFLPLRETFSLFFSKWCSFPIKNLLLLIRNLLFTVRRPLTPLQIVYFKNYFLCKWIALRFYLHYNQLFAAVWLAEYLYALIFFSIFYIKLPLQSCTIFSVSQLF